MTRFLATFLFAQPRFSFGVARLLDVGGNFNAYNISRGEAEADAKAMLADWNSVGADLVDAMDRVDAEGHETHGPEEKSPASRQPVATR